MKRLLISWLFLVLFAGLCVPVRGSVTVEAVIDDGINVVFDFMDVNATIWDGIQKYKHLFNETTFPQIVVDGLEQRNLTHVTYSLPESPIEFDNSTRSMRVRFYLSGSDILSFGYNRTTMAKTHRVRTEWIRFYANFTGPGGEHVLTLDFDQYFGRPLSEWNFTEDYLLENENRSAYFYNYTGPSPFDSLCASFVLPGGAVPRSPEGDTMVFEFPPVFWDVLLSSPIPVVGALIVVVVAVLLYRRIRGI